jgi:hypothetical protein
MVFPILYKKWKKIAIDYEHHRWYNMIDKKDKDIRYL